MSAEPDAQRMESGAHFQHWRITRNVEKSGAPGHNSWFSLRCHVSSTDVHQEDLLVPHGLFFAFVMSCICPKMYAFFPESLKLGLAGEIICLIQYLMCHQPWTNSYYTFYISAMEPVNCQPLHPIYLSLGSCTLTFKCLLSEGRYKCVLGCQLREAAMKLKEKAE